MSPVPVTSFDVVEEHRHSDDDAVGQLLECGFSRLIGAARSFSARCLATGERSIRG
ncbi:hypothetical protein [Cellulosimicrobium sp. 22601]|uniref:hypothetical protein n=1 Tax=Cellulosimicrobium sp. 22601 TaxID=3453949 RepID=UPI003F826556